VVLFVNGNSASAEAVELAMAAKKQGVQVKIETIHSEYALGDYRPPVLDVPGRSTPVQGLPNIRRQLFS